MQIFSYEIKDSSAVAMFFREIFKELGWTERASDHMDAPHLLFHLPDQGLLLLVKENTQVIGTAGIILLNNTDGLIKRFYLSQNYRGSGIANQLLDELIIHAQKLGITKLMLDVSKNNTRAIHFYEKCGFLPTTVESRVDWPESNEPESHLYYCMDLV